MKNSTRQIAAVLLALSAWVVGTLEVFAAPTYTVAPLVIDVDVEKRDIKEYPITLTNTGEAPVTIYPTVNNISVNEGGSIEEFLPPVMSDQTRSLASWIEIPRGGIDLRAGETKTVTLTLRINPNAEEGEYHALVGFPYGGNRDEAERMVARGDAPGTIISVGFKEKKTTLLKLSRFLVDRFVTGNENDAATYTVRNPGEEPLVPKGEVIFFDSRGREVGAVEVNEERISIQPGEEHTFTAAVPADGLFGKYKAFLSVEYGTKNIASVQDTTFFYIIPVKTLLIVLAALLCVVVGVSVYVHRRYFDEDATADGSEFLPVHIRDTASDPLEHDIDLRKT
jgi:hypothetical protein